MNHYRSTIYHDNIDHVTEISANFFNQYTEPRIMHWFQRNHIIVNNLINPKDRDFQKFIDAITSRNIDPTQITLTANVQTYQQIFPNNPSFETFMKFVLGLTYLLDPSRHLNLTHLEDVYTFIGITYFIYNRIDRSPLLNNNPNNKALILRDIRNLWTMFFFRKTNSHANLNGEWDILSHETRHLIFTDPSRINLTPTFNMISSGFSRTSTPLSVYIQDPSMLTQALNDAFVL